MKRIAITLVALSTLSAAVRADEPAAAVEFCPGLDEFAANPQDPSWAHVLEGGKIKIPPGEDGTKKLLRRHDRVAGSKNLCHHPIWEIVAKLDAAKKWPAELPAQIDALRVHNEKMQTIDRAVKQLDRKALEIYELAHKLGAIPPAADGDVNATNWPTDNGNEVDAAKLAVYTIAATADGIREDVAADGPFELELKAATTLEAQRALYQRRLTAMRSLIAQQSRDARAPSAGQAAVTEAEFQPGALIVGDNGYYTALTILRGHIKELQALHPEAWTAFALIDKAWDKMKAADRKAYAEAIAKGNEPAPLTTPFEAQGGALKGIHYFWTNQVAQHNQNVEKLLTALNASIRGADGSGTLAKYEKLLERYGQALARAGNVDAKLKQRLRELETGQMIGDEDVTAVDSRRLARGIEQGRRELQQGAVRVTDFEGKGKVKFSAPGIEETEQELQAGGEKESQRALAVAEELLKNPVKAKVRAAIDAITGGDDEDHPGHASDGVEVKDDAEGDQGRSRTPTPTGSMSFKPGAEDKEAASSCDNSAENRAAMLRGRRENLMKDNEGKLAKLDKDVEGKIETIDDDCTDEIEWVEDSDNGIGELAKKYPTLVSARTRPTEANISAAKARVKAWIEEECEGKRQGVYSWARSEAGKRKIVNEQTMRETVSAMEVGDMQIHRAEFDGQIRASVGRLRGAYANASSPFAQKLFSQTDVGKTMGSSAGSLADTDMKDALDAYFQAEWSEGSPKLADNVKTCREALGFKGDMSGLMEADSAQNVHDKCLSGPLVSFINGAVVEGPTAIVNQRRETIVPRGQRPKARTVVPRD